MDAKNGQQGMSCEYVGRQGFSKVGATGSKSLREAKTFLASAGRAGTLHIYCADAGSHAI